MTKGLYYLLSSIILFLITLLFTSEQIAVFLAPDISADRLEQVTLGSGILKALLLADALLLLSISLFIRKQVFSPDNPYKSLWQPSTRIPDSWNTFKNFSISVYVLLGLALVLRLIGLNSDLWIDEVITLVSFVRLPAGEIITNFTSDNQHLLVSLLSHASVSFFGESAWAIRLPSVLFGIASIWAAVKLGELVYGKKIAFFTGLLLAISYHHIWFSQNTRGYSILLFGTVYSTYLLLRALQSGKWRFWVGYAFIISISAWAHITAVFVSIAHGVVILLILLKSDKPSRQLWLPLAGLLMAAWFTLHLYSLILPQMIDFFTQPGAGTGLQHTVWRTPLWLFNEAFRSMGIDATLGWFGLAVVLFIGAICYYWYAKQDWIFLLLAISPGLILGSTMFALGRSLWPRMFYNEIGFILMFLCVALLAIGDIICKVLNKNKTGFISTLPVILLALFLLSSLPYLYQYPKQDYTGARDFVVTQKTAEDNVLGLHMAGRVYSIYYKKDWPEVNTIAEINQSMSHNGYTWLIYTLPGHIQDAKPDIYSYLKTNFNIIKVFHGTLGDGDIIVTKSKNRGLIKE